MSNWLFFNYNNWKVLLSAGLVMVFTGLIFGVTIIDFIVLVGIVLHYCYYYVLKNKKPIYIDKTKRNSDEPIKIRR